MAKSIHNIIKEGKIEVNHQGEDVTLELPKIFKDLPNIQEESIVINWANTYEILFPLLQMGIKQALIEVRAKARPKINIKTGESKSIIDDKEASQERINDYKPTITPIPGSSSKVKRELEIQRMEYYTKMVAMGLSPEQINSILEQHK